MRFLSEILNQDTDIKCPKKLHTIPSCWSNRPLVNFSMESPLFLEELLCCCLRFLPFYVQEPSPASWPSPGGGRCGRPFLTLVNYYVFRNIHIRTYIDVHLLQGRDMKMKSRSLLIILDGPPSLLLLLFSLFFLYNIDFTEMIV